MLTSEFLDATNNEEYANFPKKKLHKNHIYLRFQCIEMSLKSVVINKILYISQLIARLTHFEIAI